MTEGELFDFWNSVVTVRSTVRGLGNSDPFCFLMNVGDEQLGTVFDLRGVMQV